MEPIKVELRRATERGRLYPTYDRSAKILVVRSRQADKLAREINVDSLLLLATDDDGLLINVELMRRMQRWKSIILPPTPQPQRTADLVLSASTLDQRDFPGSVTIESETGHSRLRILFDQSEAGKWIALSESCLALVHGDQLCGFFITLS